MELIVRKISIVGCFHNRKRKGLLTTGSVTITKLNRTEQNRTE